MASVRDRQAIGKSRLISSIARVDLRVQSVERTLGFYRDVVGLDVAEQDDSTAALTSPGGDTFLTLDSRGVTGPSDPTATGLFHTAFRFPSRAALGDALARLVDAGYEVGAGDHLVSEALYVDDPDGNGIELYWDRPVEQWPAPAGEMLIPMATLPVDLHGLLAVSRGRAAVGASAPPQTDVGHVHLQVSELDATVRFYADKLGLDLIARMGASAGFFSSYGYHHNIGANNWRSRGSSPAGRDHAGLERVVFHVADRTELEHLSQRLGDDLSNGPSEEHGGVVVHDPDGIELQFIARRGAESSK